MTASSTPMAGSEGGLPLPNYLRALASDCEWTDGWEEAAPGLLAAAAELETARVVIPELLAELQNFVNGVETGLITSVADETLANVMRRARAAITKATANPIDTLPLGEGHE